MKKKRPGMAHFLKMGCSVLAQSCAKKYHTIAVAGANLKKKFHSRVITLLPLKKSILIGCCKSHWSSFNQSKCFIAEQNNDSTHKFRYEIDSSLAIDHQYSSYLRQSDQLRRQLHFSSEVYHLFQNFMMTLFCYYCREFLNYFQTCW